MRSRRLMFSPSGQTRHPTGAEDDILSHRPGQVLCITAKLIVQCRLWVISDRAARCATPSIQRQMPAGKNRRLTGQPEALEGGAKFLPPRGRKTACPDG